MKTNEHKIRDLQKENLALKDRISLLTSTLEQQGVVHPIVFNNLAKNYDTAIRGLKAIRAVEVEKQMKDAKFVITSSSPSRIISEETLCQCGEELK